MFSSFISFLKKALIFDLAELVLTTFNQSLDGPFALGLVMISTISPLFIGVFNGTILSLILAPTQ